MVEIFKTNVINEEEAERLVSVITAQSYEYAVNFDLEDCDRILRVENRRGIISTSSIETIMKKEGYNCKILL